MPKEKKKKSKLGIKTSRYYTRKCDSCDSEYPNWFTSCPNCGTSWNEAKVSEQLTEKFKKNIKIVVKITEEDFDEEISFIELVFSGDQGKLWYKMKMNIESDYYVAEMEDVPHGSVIIYYIEVNLVNGEKFIENNNGNYFYYKVGIPIEESMESPPQSEAEMIQSNIKSSSFEPEKFKKIQEGLQYNKDQSEKTQTIFGAAQTEIDPNLKICPHCNSKIKEMWSTCPFCGNKV